MTEPKVSERMRLLTEAFRTAGNCSFCNMDSGECHCGWERTAAKTDIHTKREALLSAIAEIEQRAGEIDFFASIVREHYADIVMPTVEDRDAAKPSDWINCAILELGNQHKRAEKWKEVTVAIFKFANAKSPGSTGYRDAASRLADSIAALGDEWDEAVKGEE